MKMSLVPSSKSIKEKDEDEKEDTEEEENITEIVDKHLTTFLNMIEEPDSEIFFYGIPKKDRKIFPICHRILIKFFSCRLDRNSFIVSHKRTFCYFRNHDFTLDE